MQGPNIPTSDLPTLQDLKSLRSVVAKFAKTEQDLANSQLELALLICQSKLADVLKAYLYRTISYASGQGNGLQQLLRWAYSGQGNGLQQLLRRAYILLANEETGKQLKNMR